LKGKYFEVKKNSWAIALLLSTVVFPLVSCNENDSASTQGGAGAPKAADSSPQWISAENGSGQLGDGTREDKAGPVRIGRATNWKEVSAGGYHNIAVAQDGTLWGWGANGSGQLGMSAAWSATPVKVQ
jgi:hypothetical protein